MTPVALKREHLHSIRIEHNGREFVYTQDDTHRAANVLKVKRGDVIRWRCDHGNFSVLFKKDSPFSAIGLHGRRGQSTEDALVTGDAGHYHYAVSILHEDGRAVIDDPEIIVDDTE